MKRTKESEVIARQEPLGDLEKALQNRPQSLSVSEQATKYNIIWVWLFHCKIVIEVFYFCTGIGSERYLI